MNYVFEACVGWEATSLKDSLLNMGRVDLVVMPFLAALVLFLFCCKSNQAISKETKSAARAAINVSLPQRRRQKGIKTSVRTVFGSLDNPSDCVLARTPNSTPTNQKAVPTSEKETNALRDLRLLLQNKDPSLLAECMKYAAPYEQETELLLRYLRARNFKAKSTMKMMIDDLKWRTEKEVLKMRTCSAQDVLGCDPAKVQAWLPHGLLGFDCKNRPIIYKNYGGFMPRRMIKEEILPFTTIQKLVDYDVWVTERSVCLLPEEAQGFVVILDLTGWSIVNATSTGMWYCKALADVGAPHYPERLSQMLIIGAPWIFTATFNIIYSWLDERTQDKIKLLGPQSQYRPVLEKIMDITMLPKIAGGLAELSGPEGFEAQHRRDAPVHHSRN